MNTYFNCHTHTAKGSNLRLLDSTNRPEDVINKAIELGLSGVAFTEHEFVGNAVEINKIAKELQKTNPDFKIGLGNEIYLTNTRDSGQKYYHFILIAKNAVGHKMLRELSSTSWYNYYKDRGCERVPTLKSELKDVIEKYGRGNLIATTACIGGELSQNLLMFEETKSRKDTKNALEYIKNVDNFIYLCKDLFNDDFYLECSPATNEEQKIVNKSILNISNIYNVKMVVGTDAHFLTPQDRWVHKAYLNSKDGDREVDDFYEFCRLMSYDDVYKFLSESLDEKVVENILSNTMEIYDKIEFYDLFNNQKVSSVKVKDYPRIRVGDPKYPTLKKLWESEDIQERYWINQCAEKIKELNLGAEEVKYWEELEEEARVKTVIGEKLGTNMFQYPNTLQYYIDKIWECGSTVGAGRGSSCAALNHYLLGITQLDPIKWNLPFFRYMNDERTELGDIDIDICPSKRPEILNEIKKERSIMLDKNLPGWAIENLGCTLVATFGTEGTKAAILTACRGYRSEDYQNGIDVDEAQYMSSLVPQERGFSWSIRDVVYGNPEKNRRPVKMFINAVNQYPGLLNIIESIEGLVNHRGSHASGVILFEDDPFDKCAFMKTPNGEITTQFDLHDCEYMGLVKYDFLVTEVQDKLVQAINLLKEDGIFEKEKTLKEIYNEYFHPDVLPIEEDKIWDALGNVSVLNTFQFDSLEGSKVAKKLKPRNVLEMSAANGLMRLMGEEGEERPQDKYAKQKADISLWYKEMKRENLTPKEMEYLEPYFKNDYGVPPDQEALMLMLMDKNICNFSLADANAARKIVGKKQMNKIPELRKKVLEQASSAALGRYVWKHGAGPQMGYSFSKIHALAYSFIGVQTLHIATNWNPIYWNTACLIVNSGATDPENSGQTDYSKIAKAMGDIISAGIKIGLPDINKSEFGFKPDVESNQILYGLKAMLNVGDDIIESTIKNRPYSSIKDYYYKVKPNRQAMISLIKGGAFDSFMDRVDAMIWFIWETCDKKRRLTLQNMTSLIKYDLLPENTVERKIARNVYELNRYLKSNCKHADSNWYRLDELAIKVLKMLDFEDLIQENYFLYIQDWESLYQRYMDVFRDWIAEKKDEILQALNEKIFLEAWEKDSFKNKSAAEMESLCFYYHEHELSKVNKTLYGFSNFFDLPEEPIVDREFERGGKTIRLYKLSKICGTCIAKNKAKSTVSLLTENGVVNVKFRKEYFSMFDKQISEKQPNGTKKVKEKSWFNRGSMIAVQGIRSGDSFISKKYASSGGHQLYKITEVRGDRILITSERYTGGTLEDEI